MGHLAVAAFLAALAACAQVGPDPAAGGVKANTPMPPIQGRPAADEYDTPPRLISGNAPVYPITRVQKGVDGEATISYTIAEDGTTKDFVVVSATYPYFGIHAVIAVKEWRFQPALKAGVPVSIHVTQSFRYMLPK